ncbi:hypothetical protein [Pseudomonas syringae group genomosp. 7]|uniref:Transmembrane protein n=1 Tax=Pseudomonas syringae pv. tagetis TaxID=129140 RepID=A0ABW7NVJ8_9PSED
MAGVGFFVGGCGLVRLVRGGGGGVVGVVCGFGVWGVFVFVLGGVGVFGGCWGGVWVVVVVVWVLFGVEVGVVVVVLLVVGVVLVVVVGVGLLFLLGWFVFYKTLFFFNFFRRGGGGLYMSIAHWFMWYWREPAALRD